MEAEKYLNPVSLASIIVAIGTLGYTLWDGERSNARENDLSFSQFAAKISRLEADLEQLGSTVSSKETEIQALRDQLQASTNNASTVSIDELTSRVAALEASRPSGVDVNAEDVARVLVRDYLETLKGPPGPPGPMGERGPAGKDGSANTSTSDSSGSIIIQPDFSSDFPTGTIGSMEVSLLKCDQDGSAIKCSVLVKETGSRAKKVVFAQNTRIALPSAEWVQNRKRTANGESTDGSKYLYLKLTPGIPTRIDFEFPVPSSPLQGLLGFELYEENIGGSYTWPNVSL